MERTTLQRRAIFQVFEQTNRPLCVQEVLDLASAVAPGLGIATVYRNLKTLVSENKLQPVDMTGGVVFYELPGLQHHHHFSCLSCLKVFDVEACGLNLKKIIPNGFQLQQHEILMSGYCDGCSES